MQARNATKRRSRILDLEPDNIKQKKRKLSITKQEKGTKLKMNERIERSSGEDRSRPEEGDEN